MSIEMSEFDRSKVISLENTSQKHEEIGNPLLKERTGTEEQQAAQLREWVLEKYHFTDSELHAYASGVRDKAESDKRIFERYIEQERSEMVQKLRQQMEKEQLQRHPEQRELEEAIGHLNEHLAAIAQYLHIYDKTMQNTVFTLEEAKEYSARLREELTKICKMTYRNYGHQFDALREAKEEARKLFP